MGKLFYLMGKSASGKDTVYRRLMDACPRLLPVVLYTTRPMRTGERDGVEYHFTTEDQIRMYRERGVVIEERTYQTAAGPWTYATLDDGRIGRDGNDYLAIGTLESYDKILRYFGPEKVVPIYITVDSQTRWERALAREQRQKNPDYKELERRFLADEEDFSEANLEKSGISRRFLNNSLDDCVETILGVIQEKEI